VSTSNLLAIADLPRRRGPEPERNANSRCHALGGLRFIMCVSAKPSMPTLRLLAAVRRSIRRHGGDDPSSRQIDELLDERAKR
jgi:hypothetical protein